MLMLSYVRVMNTAKTHINQGDIVMLKLGGPEMYVEMIDPDCVCYCIWYNDNQELQKDYFQESSLTLLNKNENLNS